MIKLGYKQTELIITITIRIFRFKTLKNIKPKNR